MALERSLSRGGGGDGGSVAGPGGGGKLYKRVDSTPQYCILVSVASRRLTPLELASGPVSPPPSLDMSRPCESVVID